MAKDNQTSLERLFDKLVQHLHEKLDDKSATSADLAVIRALLKDAGLRLEQGIESDDELIERAGHELKLLPFQPDSEAA